MGAPKLSKAAKQIVDMKKEAARDIESLNPTDAERNLGGYDEIVAHREVERQQMLKNLGATPKPEPVTVVAKPLTKANANLEDMLTSFTKKVTDANAALVTERRAKIEAEVQPLLDEAHSLLTRHGILVNTHLAHVANIAATDWAALYKVVPPALEFDTKANRMVAKNHEALWRYQEASKAAAAALRNTFGDQQVGRELDPVSLSHAVQMMKSLVSTGAWDGVDGMPSATYRRLLSHLRVWVERARRWVASSVDAIEKFQKAEAAVRDILANVAPADVEPTPPRATLRDLGERPPEPYSQTSWTDFDPRDHDSQRAPSGPEVVRTNQGIRVGSIRPEPDRGDGKVIGITTGGA